MLHLRLSAPSDRVDAVAQALRATAGVRRLVVHRDGDAPAVVTADVEREAADDVVALLAALRVAPDDYVLAHLDVVAPEPALQPAADDDRGPAWVEVLGEALAHARPVRRYRTLMAVAGVIAALGVIDRNAILVIGAMAASPDLPLCAICVGLVGRSGRLARRASLTLLVGLLIATAAAAALTALLDLADALPRGFELSEHGLGTLATVDEFTVLVALAAGVAGVLAFQTRASAAVGVAISVTTIPASAFLGVGVGLWEPGRAVGALGVLSVNVAALVLSGTATLVVQRLLARRRPG